MRRKFATSTSDMEVSACETAHVCDATVPGRQSEGDRHDVAHEEDSGHEPSRCAAEALEERHGSRPVTEKTHGSGPELAGCAGGAEDPEEDAAGNEEQHAEGEVSTHFVTPGSAYTQ